MSVFRISKPRYVSHEFLTKSVNSFALYQLGCSCSQFQVLLRVHSFAKIHKQTNICVS